MKKWKKILGIASGATLMMATLFSVSFAWFYELSYADLGSGKGYTASAYFAGGDGSENKPYLLRDPIHLYNLAWLQYLGYFNTTDTSGNLLQKHFALVGDLDMTGWTLPPIGTTDYPFMGTFTGASTTPGQYYTISNLTVDNVLSSDGVNGITQKPSTVSTLSGINIVGLFGVVGNYADKYSTLSNSEGKPVYATSANSISDFYLTGSTIRNDLLSTLIGLAAGYVNAPVTGVGVSSSSVKIAPGASAFSPSLTSNLSDYTTIGYATPDYKATRTRTTTTLKNPTLTNVEFAYTSSGSSTGWGGSIEMDKLFNRLSYFRSNATGTVTIPSNTPKTQTVTVNADGTRTTTTNSTYATGSFKEYYDLTGQNTQTISSSDTRLKGSVSFSIRTDTANQFIYLYGKKNMSSQVTTNTYSYTGKWTIAYSGYYLYITSGGSLSTTTSSSSATQWTMSTDAGGGTLSAVNSGTTYYLVGTPTSTTAGSVSLTTTAASATSWTYSSNALSFIGIYSNASRTYYLRYSSGWKLSTTRYTGTYTRLSALSGSTTSTVNSSIETRDTYVPLSVYDYDNGNYLASEKNTGYIVSGINYENPGSDGGDAWPYRSGDIRVSSYGISQLNNALNGDTSYSDDGSNMVVLTKTARDTSSFHRIKDSYNPTGASDILTNYTALSIDQLGLSTKYTNSRRSLHTLLRNATNVYGLHFMDASINANNLASAELAYIDKTIYQNYSLPRNSIDFNLPKKGYINFFSGTYFNSNDSFFSFHKITRDSTTHAITAINEITAIYSDGNPLHDYVYQYNTSPVSYSNPTFSSTYKPEDHGYPLAFDTSWIKYHDSNGSDPIVTNAVYYFEIPVNDGEYALGSVTGGIGSYLLYLDISANAQLINRTSILEDLLSTSKTYEFPLGIALVSLAGNTIDPLAAAAFVVYGGFSGTLNLARSENTITATSDSDSFAAVYEGDAITLARAGSSTTPPALVEKAGGTTTSEIKRITNIDYNTATGDTSRTVLTDNNGNFSVTDANGTALTEYQNNEGTLCYTSDGGSINTSGLSGTLLTYWYSHSAADSTITVTFAVAIADQASGNYKDFTGYTLTLASTTDDLTVYVTEKNGSYSVVFIANGVQTSVSLGSTISVTHG